MDDDALDSPLYTEDDAREDLAEILAQFRAGLVDAFPELEDYELAEKILNTVSKR